MIRKLKRKRAFSLLAGLAVAVVAAAPASATPINGTIAEADMVTNGGVEVTIPATGNDPCSGPVLNDTLAVELANPQTGVGAGVDDIIVDAGSRFQLDDTDPGNQWYELSLKTNYGLVAPSGSMNFVSGDDYTVVAEFILEGSIDPINISNPSNCVITTGDRCDFLVDFEGTLGGTALSGDYEGDMPPPDGEALFEVQTGEVVGIPGHCDFTGQIEGPLDVTTLRITFP